MADPASQTDAWTHAGTALRNAGRTTAAFAVQLPQLLAGVAAGFLAVAAATSRPLEVPSAVALAGALAVACGLALRPAWCVAAAGAGGGAILGVPGDVPWALAAAACLPAALAQLVPATSAARVAAVAALAFVLAAAHATFGYAGAGYWMPLALGLAVVGLALLRAPGLGGRAAIATAGAAALFVGYA